MGLTDERKKDLLMIAVNAVNAADKAARKHMVNGYQRSYDMLYSIYLAVYACIAESEFWSVDPVVPVQSANPRRLLLQFEQFTETFLNQVASSNSIERNSLLRRELMATSAYQLSDGDESVIESYGLGEAGDARVEADASEYGTPHLASRRGRLSLVIACRYCKIIDAGARRGLDHKDMIDSKKQLIKIAYKGLIVEQLPVKLFDEQRRKMTNRFINFTERQGQALMLLADEYKCSRQAVMRGLASQVMARYWSLSKGYIKLLESECPEWFPAK